MSEFISGKKKLGILGGGQLGKMLIQAASRWDVTCAVLDPNENCSAAPYAHEFTKGAFNDYDSVLNFGRGVDVITIEIENVNTEALKKLRDEGKTIHPSPEVIETIKDKGKQKSFYKENNLNTSAFRIVESKEEILTEISFGKITLPFVQKLCREGYDGRGVAVIKDENDLGKLLDGESVIEDMVDIHKEIAVLLSRNEKDEVNAFPPVEMEFNAEANLVEMLIAPARIDNEVVEKAVDLGKKVISSLNLVGLLAVEMFIDSKGDILINESAPRPHNSGHHTIEGNVTSQYDQLLRAILNLPLSTTKEISKAVMINVLGDKGFSGDVDFKNLDKVFETEGAYLHLYGKKDTKPFRKMGHITICGSNHDDLINKANDIKKVLKVQAK